MGGKSDLLLKRFFFARFWTFLSKSSFKCCELIKIIFHSQLKSVKNQLIFFWDSQLSRIQNNSPTKYKITHRPSAEPCKRRKASKVETHEDPARRHSPKDRLGSNAQLAPGTWLRMSSRESHQNCDPAAPCARFQQPLATSRWSRRTELRFLVRRWKMSAGSFSRSPKCQLRRRDDRWRGLLSSSRKRRFQLRIPARVRWGLYYYPCSSRTSKFRRLDQRMDPTWHGSA